MRQSGLIGGSFIGHISRFYGFARITISIKIQKEQCLGFTAMRIKNDKKTLMNSSILYEGVVFEYCAISNIVWNSYRKNVNIE
jgi:hypothetical protein